MPLSFPGTAPEISSTARGAGTILPGFVVEVSFSFATGEDAGAWAHSGPTPRGINQRAPLLSFFCSSMMQAEPSEKYPSWGVPQYPWSALMVFVPIRPSAPTPSRCWRALMTVDPVAWLSETQSQPLVSPGFFVCQDTA